MTDNGNRSSRREFVASAGRVASAISLTTLMTPGTAFAATDNAGPSTSGEWDLSWLATLATATDRAVFDWPSLGDPADPQVMYFAERYLDVVRQCTQAGNTKRAWCSTSAPKQ